MGKTSATSLGAFPDRKYTHYVDVEGTIYEFYGMSFMESIYLAVAQHIEDDGDFGEYIYITLKEDKEYFRRVYSPAFLCAFDFLDRASLYNLLVSSAISPEDQDYIEE